MDRKEENRFNFKRFQKNIEGSYRAIFIGDTERLNIAANEVLADLKKYTNATKSNFSKDPLEMARAEGRREVFLHIMDYLKLDFLDDVYDLENDYDLT